MSSPSQVPGSNKQLQDGIYKLYSTGHYLYQIYICWEFFTATIFTAQGKQGYDIVLLLRQTF